MRIRLALASALVCGACAAAARAQDELGVFVEESADPPGPIEAPRLKVDGRTVFVRPFAEAFVDPDQRMNLEPKYYFALTEEPPRVDDNRPLHCVDLDRIRWQVFSVAPDRTLSWLTAQHAFWSMMGSNLRELERPLNLRWLDYRSGRETERYRQVAFLAGAGALRVAEGLPPRLCVAQVRWNLSRVVIERLSAQRDLSAGELNRWAECLDTLDRPPPSQPGANLQGRVIAVWKQINGRHAVDFYSQSLHPDADRRLWLTRGDDDWGPPAHIQFHEIWIQKPSGPQRETVLAVRYWDLRQDPPLPRWVAYDFPLARPVVLDNLRKLSAGASKTNAKSKFAAPTVDIGQLLGEDLVDEYSRRLVDAVDR